MDSEMFTDLLSSWVLNVRHWAFPGWSSGTNTLFLCTWDCSTLGARSSNGTECTVMVCEKCFVEKPEGCNSRWTPEWPSMASNQSPLFLSPTPPFIIRLPPPFSNVTWWIWLMLAKRGQRWIQVWLSARIWELRRKDRRAMQETEAGKPVEGRLPGESLN